MRILFAASLLYGAMALPGSAQEQGSLVLEIGGTPAQFELWAGQSDWSGSESWASVNIYSRPADDTTAAQFTLFTLGFEVVGGDGQNGEVSVSVLDKGKLYGEDEAGGLKVTVASVSISGDLLTVTGSLSGEMGPSDNFGRDIDLSSPVALNGTFTATLGPVE